MSHELQIPEVSTEDPIKRALAFAQVARPKIYSSRIDEIKIEITGLKTLIKGALKVESGAVGKAESRIEDLENELLKNRASLEAANAGFRIFNTDPFTWRRADKWPTFAFFLVSSERRTCEFVLGSEHQFRISTPHSSASFRKLGDFYGDVKTNLSSVIANRRAIGVALSCRYDNGLIPPKVRKNISRAQKIFGEDEVFLLAEAKEWSIRMFSFEPTTTIKRDPLVIGYETEGENFWLVDSFDQTYMEELAGAWKKNKK